MAEISGQQANAILKNGWRTLDTFAMRAKMANALNIPQSDPPQMISPYVQTSYICNSGPEGVFGTHPHGWWPGGTVHFNPATGANVVNDLINAAGVAAVVATTPKLLLATSAGKTLFVTYLSVTFDDGTQNGLIIEDGSAGTHKHNGTVQTVNIEQVLHNSMVPLSFSTGVFIDLSATNRNAKFNIRGWEQ